MTAVLLILAALAITVTLQIVWQARQPLIATTLASAWRWSGIAAVFWALVWGMTALRLATPPIVETLWYVAALLALCPAIAVLGARRPGIGVWTAFVILPMLAVLGWPVLTIWSGDQPRSPAIETPALLGFVLVLMMGAGNYIGTKFSLSATLYVVALCLAVGPLSTAAPKQLDGSLMARHVATICLGLAMLMARQPLLTAWRSPDRFDRLWDDYRNAFGIVWAKRFQDRLNGIANQQQWSAHLADHGFVWTDGATAAQNEETRNQMEQTIRWLLRRFADPQWIDSRLNAPIETPKQA